MTDKALSASLSQLADIELPTGAPESGVTLWLALIGIAVIVALGYAWRKYRTPPARNINASHDALTQLAHVQRQWQQGQLDERETAYHLATVLRLGLSLPQLERECPVCIKQHHAQWSETISLLTTLRYQREDAAKLKLSATTFTLIADWLRGSA